MKRPPFQSRGLLATVLGVVADAMAHARRLGRDLPTEVTAIMKSGRFHKQPGTLA